MKIETFFEKFDQIANASNVVTMMRKLVIKLAVQGKLVEQRLGDAPAEGLVRRVATSLPRKQSENPFLTEIAPTITAETAYELPNGWSWLPLGYVGIWATGCGFPKQYQGEAVGEFLFCKVSDMNLPGNEVEIRNTVNTIDREVMKKIRARANPVGTVIFPKIGGAIATNKRRLVIKSTIIDNNCSGIQPIGLTESRWLLLLMRSIDLAKYQSGTSVPAVSHGTLNPIRIGLPPLAEQKRIVARVDDLMALCDRLETQLQRRDTQHAALARASLARFAETPTPANLSFLFHDSYTIEPADLRKTILTLAVQGKLVAQDSNDEPASKLIERIHKQKEDLRRKGKIGKQNFAPKIDEKDIPYKGPEGWLWTRWDAIALKIGDIDHKMPDAVNEGIPYVSPRDFFPANRIDFDRAKRISFDDFIRLSSKIKPEVGDLIYPRYGTIGECRLVTVQRDFLASYSCAVIKTLPNLIDAKYQYFFSISDLCRNQARAAENKTTQANVGIKSIKEFLFPLPPFAEQRRIVAKVDQLMALVDQLEAQLTASRASAMSLMNAVVDELTA